MSRVLKSILLLALFSALSAAPNAQQIGSSLFEEIIGEYAFAPELCANEFPLMRVTLKNGKLTKQLSSEKWSTQDYEEFYKTEFTSFHVEWTEAFLGISKTADETTLLSVFVVVPEKNYKELGFPGEYPAHRTPLAYFASRLEGTLTPSRFSQITSPDTAEDYAFLYPCE